MTNATDDAVPSDSFRAQLLAEMLILAPELGWTQAALTHAADRAGLTAGEVELACPNGPGDLIALWAAQAADAAGARLRRADAAALKIREKTALGVAAYLDAFEPHKAAFRRAAATPGGLSAGPARSWRAADALWRAMDDPSADFNWYSKRLILAGVIASTLLVFLGTDDRQEVERFLARRIEGVMAFEKTKARAREAAQKLPNPLDLLGRRAQP